MGGAQASAEQAQKAGTTTISPSLTGQFSFPTTGVSVQDRAVLLAIDDVSLPLKQNLCYYLSKPTV